MVELPVAEGAAEPDGGAAGLAGGDARSDGLAAAAAVDAGGGLDAVALAEQAASDPTTKSRTVVPSEPREPVMIGSSSRDRRGAANASATSPCGS
jgi:hypothetical protein